MRHATHSCGYDPVKLLNGGCDTANSVAPLAAKPHPGLVQTELIWTVTCIYTVNSLLIELGYNEMTAYIEVTSFPLEQWFPNFIFKMNFWEPLP